MCTHNCWVRHVLGMLGIVSKSACMLAGDMGLGVHLSMGYAVRAALLRVYGQPDAWLVPDHLIGDGIHLLQC